MVMKSSRVIDVSSANRNLFKGANAVTRKLFVSLFLIVGLAALLISTAASQSNRSGKDRLLYNGVMEDEDRPASSERRSDAIEAPTGFDNLTNGFTKQGPDFETLNEDTVVALRSFNDNRFIFEEAENIQDGLGPTYNAQCKAVGSATRTL